MVTRLTATGILVTASLATAAACSVSDTVPGGDGGAAAVGPGATELCEEQCIPLHVAGEADYLLLRECLLCSACSDACASSQDGACVNGAATEHVAGCSAAAAGDCAACVDSVCALQQLPNTSFMGVCAPWGDACALNTECVALNNCVAQCVLAGPGTGGAAAGGAAAGGATP